MPEASYGRSNCWLTVILITPEKFGADREAVRLALGKESIESRPIWKPMHLQPVFEITPGARGITIVKGIRQGWLGERLVNIGQFSINRIKNEGQLSIFKTPIPCRLISGITPVKSSLGISRGRRDGRKLMAETIFRFRKKWNMTSTI